MKVIIMGSTGMLGNSVAKHFLNDSSYITYLTHKNEKVKLSEESFFFNPLINDLNTLPEADYYINCIGVIKPFVPNNVKNSVLLNSLFPLQLSDFCEKNNKRLIHITTDCVFSGQRGNYTEADMHDCEDAYGKTKSLGEPTNCMVLRTSIIGDEIHNNASLISWLKYNSNNTVNGYNNHIWNGMTTVQYAKICDIIIKKNLYKKELFHVFSNALSKYELLKLLNSHYKLNINILEHETEFGINRSLSTIKNLNSILKIPELKEQINNLGE